MSVRCNEPRTAPAGNATTIPSSALCETVAARPFFSPAISPTGRSVIRSRSALCLTVSWFYRAASNKLADAAIQELRRDATGAEVPMFNKGSAGARQAMAHLRSGGLLGMLVDQKLNEGIAVPFFGRPAMTTPALAQFALRFRCPVIPIRPVRLGPARFRVICEPPMALPDTGDRAADVYAVTTAMNATLERWIREQPECWLWLHRRWPEDDTSRRCRAA